MSSHEELIARKMLRIQEIHRMDPARTALLVIDMQRRFTDSESSLCMPTAREGRYGGSSENRTRFLKEIIEGVRSEAPGLVSGCYPLDEYYRSRAEKP